eukprot:5410978-Amphidinium_carterae.1
MSDNGGDRERLLALVKQKPLALRYAPESCKGDREIVLAAVENYGGAFQFAAESFKSDREI